MATTDVGAGRGPHVILTGFMASGKSAVGRRLARRLGRDFLDTDRIVEQTAGLTIPEIFEQRGEEGFRDLEHEVVAGLNPEVPAVISTGGGTFVFERNQQSLRRLGPVVCIMVPLGTVLERATRTTRRPLAQGPEAGVRLAALYNERLPEYRKADILVETTGMSVDQAAVRVQTMLRPWLGAGAGTRPGRSPQKQQ